jgi:hypothetical protein
LYSDDVLCPSTDVMRYHIVPLTDLPEQVAVHEPPFTVAFAVTFEPVPRVVFRVALVVLPLRRLMPPQVTSGVGGAEAKRPLATYTYVTPKSELALLPLIVPILYQVLRVRV